MKIHEHPSFSSQFVCGCSKVSACRWTTKIVRLDLTRWWQLALLQVGDLVRDFFLQIYEFPHAGRRSMATSSICLPATQLRHCGFECCFGSMEGWGGRLVNDDMNSSKCQPVQAALALLRGSMSVDAVCDLVASVTVLF